jgi:hypothetical protein
MIRPFLFDARQGDFFYDNLVQETWFKPAAIGGRITSIPSDAILPTPAEMVCSRSSFDAGPCSFPRQLLD